MPVQTSRLFQITYLLLERGTVTARELAEHFEVSPRTIYRDVEKLSAAGIPVYMEKGRNGGIRLLPGFILDKAVLTPAEKEEILSALHGLAAAGVGDAGNNGASAGALKKLAALFGITGGNWIEIDFSGWSWNRAAREGFEALKAAVLSRRVIAFTYYSSGTGGADRGERTSRVAEPLKLVFRGQSWYLYGWCRLRAGPRFFKLSRMADIVLLDEVFDREAPERVTERESLWSPPESIAVVFRANAAIAFRIYDEYARGNIRREEDGSLLVSTELPRGEWLISYFMSYGQHLELLEPAELRAELKETLEAMTEKYAGGRPSI